MNNTNKVSIKLMGGLGNYLFQISFAYAYGLEHNKTPIFSINHSIQIHNNVKTYIENIFSKLKFGSLNFNTEFSLFNENEFSFQEIPRIDGNVLFHGYFQSEKYFIKYEQEIRELFLFSQEFAENLKKKYINFFGKNTCSLHVRRGDYISKQEFHPILPIEYYTKALEFIDNDANIIVFSDDIPWCKNNLIDLSKNLIFMEGNKDYEDILLMSLCENNIISNSTFSWWGAWLNKNKNKKVICPYNWFGPSYAHLNTKDLYCNNWIII